MKFHPPKRTRPPKRPAARLTSAYRWYLTLGKAPISHQVFARKLSHPLKPLGISLSHDTTRAWEIGNAYPSGEVLEALLAHAPKHSWQWQFAQDMRAVLNPEIHEPASPLGRRILWQDRHNHPFTPPGDPHDQP